MDAQVQEAVLAATMAGEWPSYRREWPTFDEPRRESLFPELYACAQKRASEPYAPSVRPARPSLPKKRKKMHSETPQPHHPHNKRKLDAGTCVACGSTDKDGKLPAGEHPGTTNNVGWVDVGGQVDGVRVLYDENNRLVRSVHRLCAPCGTGHLFRLCWDPTAADYQVCVYTKGGHLTRRFAEALRKRGRRPEEFPEHLPGSSAQKKQHAYLAKALERQRKQREKEAERLERANRKQQEKQQKQHLKQKQAPPTPKPPNRVAPTPKSPRTSPRTRLQRQREDKQKHAVQNHRDSNEEDLPLCDFVKCSLSAGALREDRVRVLGKELKAAHKVLDDVKVREFKLDIRAVELNAELRAPVTDINASIATLAYACHQTLTQLQYSPENWAHVLKMFELRTLFDGREAELGTTTYRLDTVTRLLTQLFVRSLDSAAKTFVQHHGDHLDTLLRALKDRR